MGDLLDICQEEYERFLPLVEESAGISLSHLHLMEVDDYLDYIEEQRQFTNERMMSCYYTPCRYNHGSRWGVDRDVIVVNPQVMEQRGVDPRYIMIHELSHAAHGKLESEYFSEADGETFIAFTEGFALFFQTHCVPGLNDELQQYSKDLAIGLLLADDVGKSNHIIAGFSFPRFKFRGYSFFKRTTDLMHSQDYAFEMLKKPPEDWLEILHPMYYLERVAGDE